MCAAAAVIRRENRKTVVFRKGSLLLNTEEGLLKSVQVILCQAFEKRQQSLSLFLIANSFIAFGILANLYIVLLFPRIQSCSSKSAYTSLLQSDPDINTNPITKNKSKAQKSVHLPIFYSIQVNLREFQARLMTEFNASTLLGAVLLLVKLSC